MIQSICFIANFSKTYLFHGIAQRLKVDGVKTYWVCTNEKLFNFLKENYPVNNILLLNRTSINSHSSAIQDFKLNELIYGDRVLKEEPIFGKQFLTSIQQPIHQFILSNGIQRIFGEITWAHEILIHRMCCRIKALNCIFLNPHVTRIPNNQFAFFIDEQQAQILEIDPVDSVIYPVLKIQEPSYMKLNKALKHKRNSFSGRLNKIKRFITNENIDPNDPTLIVNELTRLFLRCKEEYRKESYKFVKKETIESIKHSPYVYLGLHKQPEASVDVFGRYYENQLQNIVNLWRILPAGWKLVIKEHPMAIGDRPVSFYRSIKKLQGVVLLSDEIPSYSLIKHAELIVTITGTMAYEAALMGIPSATFAPTFFNRLHLCQQIDLNNLLSMNDLKSWIMDLQSTTDNRHQFTNYLMANSFAGRLLDPITDKTVLDDENIKQLAAGFRSILCQETVAISFEKSGQTKTPLTIAA